jgi:type II secretory pathway pseudopilin PulG
MCKFFLSASLGLCALVLPGIAQAQENRERRWSTEEAIQSCKDSIQQEAHQRFGNAPVNFRQTNIDNNPGRNDWVAGTIAVKTSRWRPSEVYRFSCNVDFNTGRLRSAHIGVPNF